jgi:hypothetical protein
MKTANFTLNIGLGNNPFTAETIKNQILLAYPLNIVEFREAIGEYEGHDEPTLVVKVSAEFDMNLADVDSMSAIVKKRVEDMCLKYTQECIPYRLVSTDRYGFESTIEKLVYNKLHKGEKYEFDGKYFIEM